VPAGDVLPWRCRSLPATFNTLITRGSQPPSTCRAALRGARRLKALGCFCPVLRGRVRSCGGPSILPRIGGRQDNPAGDGCALRVCRHVLLSAGEPRSPGSFPPFSATWSISPTGGAGTCGRCPCLSASPVFCWPSTPSCSGRAGAFHPRPRWRDPPAPGHGVLSAWFGLLHAYLPGFDKFRGVSKLYPGHTFRDPAFGHGA